jgi:hypothetical protein
MMKIQYVKVRRIEIRAPGIEEGKIRGSFDAPAESPPVKFRMPGKE